MNNIEFYFYKVTLLSVFMIFFLTSCSLSGSLGNNSTGVSAALSDSENRDIFFDKEACREASENVENIELTVGMWVAPRAHLMKTQEEADRRFAEIKEAGINMYYSFYEDTDDAWLDRMLKAAEKNDIDVLISLERVAALSDIDKNLSLARRTMEYPSVIGFNMYDEPSASVNSLLRTQYEKLRKLVGSNKIIMCNMLPNYAPHTLLGISEGSKNRTVYQTYLDRFMNEVGTDALSFDFYPFQSNTESDKEYLRNMLRNLCDIVICAREYRVPAWGFLQNSSWDVTRVPNDDELRFLSHIHLVFGLKSYSYFLYAQPSDKPGGEGIFKGMIDYDGERTEIYDRVKINNEEISGMRGRYLDYNLQGFLVDSLSSSYKSCITKNLQLDRFGPLENIKTDCNLLIGCFENSEGLAYYVMNFGYINEGNVSLYFNEEGSDFTVWGSNGIEQMGHAEKLEISLRKGEGKFIELKTYKNISN